MKQLKFISGFFALVIAFTVSSCSDDDEVTKSKADLLTQHGWKLSSGTSSNANLQNEIDLVVAFQYYYIFNKDKSYTTGIPLSSDVETGKWEFSTDETKLILDKGTSDEVTLTIGKLDDSSLELTGNDPDYSNASYTLKFVKR